jgi:hypothetical protein
VASIADALWNTTMDGLLSAPSAYYRTAGRNAKPAATRCSTAAAQREIALLMNIIGS